MASINSTLPEGSLNELLSSYHGTPLLVVAILFIPLEVVFVVLRTYSRSLHDKVIGTDGVLVWLCLLMCEALNVVAIVMVKYGGLGRHTDALLILGQGRKIVLWAKLLAAASWFYLGAITLSRLSVIVLYLRIFVSRVYRWACYILAALMILGFLINGLVGALGCRPFRYLWDPTLTGGVCINMDLYFHWINFPNIFIDICIIVLPLPAVWGTRTTTAQKVGMTITFCTGIIGLVASVMRFELFVGKPQVTDKMWATVQLMIWTIVEPGMYLIAACLLRFRPLIQHIIKGTFLETFGDENPMSSDFTDANLAAHDALRADSATVTTQGSQHMQERQLNNGMSKDRRRFLPWDLSRTPPGEDVEVPQACHLPSSNKP